MTHQHPQTSTYPTAEENSSVTTNTQRDEALVTIEVAGPGQRYTLTEAPIDLDVHLAGPSEHGVGPCLCGFDRFARTAEGRLAYGFSVGGGVKGPGYRHRACEECVRRSGDLPVRGTHTDVIGEAREVRDARQTVAALAARNTSSHAEAVEATRDVFDMLGIGGKA